MNERRRAERVPIAIPIDFGNGSGMTRDMSGLGIYFSTDKPFEVGMELDFRLFVQDAVRVRCKGRVVRVVPERDGYGVGITIDSYELDETPPDGLPTRPDIVIEELRKHHD